MSDSEQFLSIIADKIADNVVAKISSRLNKSSSEPLAYSISEAALKMNLSESTIRSMMREKDIAVVRRGTRVLITRREIDAWLERNTA